MRNEIIIANNEVHLVGFDKLKDDIIFSYHNDSLGIRNKKTNEKILDCHYYAKLSKERTIHDYKIIGFLQELDIECKHFIPLLNDSYILSLK